MGAALLVLEQVRKQYRTAAGPVDVLNGIDLAIETGQFVAIMGPSGSGKSTLMNILGCLDTPSSGRYLLDGGDVGARPRDALARLRNEVIGFVFQGYNLLARASLLDNVALPLVYRGMAKAERRARAQVMLDKVGLGRHAGAWPNQVSGGEQQRVAIARALINTPKLILADEPTGNLDTRTGDDIMRIFSDLNREAGITVVMVTHEPDVAAWAERLIRLVDGRIQSDAPVAARRATAPPA
jgi:putative ABC transport system ATP-binding protein